MDLLQLPKPVQQAIESFAAKYTLHTLPLHANQVLMAFVLYDVIFRFVSPALSRRIIPTFYAGFNKRTKINWDVHVVSFTQAVLICATALWGMFTDAERAAWKENTTEGALNRIFGYTAYGGAVQALATGYFMWDLVISSYYMDIFGPGFVAHALSALLVFSLGFRPFVNFYAPIFILFELSSPFLNIHWFCDKVGLTGSRTQLINGIFLISTFFGCRIIWGTYQSIIIFKDIFQIYSNPPSETLPSAEDLSHPGELPQEKIEPHPYAGKSIPLWLAVVYLGSNLCLNGLNYYWFSRMITTVTSRFTGPEQVKKEKVKPEDEKVWVEGKDLDIANSASALEKEADGLKKRYNSS